MSGMSALDIRICIGELEENVLDSWVGKIYGMEGLFLFKLNPPGEESRNLIIEPGRRIHLTSLKHSTPKRPPSFAMLLRKQLSDKKLVEISQPDFERIVKLSFEKNEKKRFVFCELFGDGNLILCDENREIIQPYKRKDWKDRKIRAGEKYSLPPKQGKDITEITKEDITEILQNTPDLVRGLARNLAIGGDLAEEICARAELDKETDPDSLDETEIRKIFSTIKNLLESDISPKIIYENDEPKEVLPFKFKTKTGEKTKSFDSFNQALDHFFHEFSKGQVEEEKEEKLEKEISRVKDRLEKQKDNLKNLENLANEAKIKADAISQYHEEIDYVLNKVNETRENQGWEKVEKIIENPEHFEKKWGKPVKRVSPDEGSILLELPEEEVELDIRLSSFENASKFYEKNKKMKEKMEGAKEAIRETEIELEEVRKEGLETTPEVITEETREKKWFEKYRWFFSSQDLLVVAGRDKKTNQEVVEKQMEKNDQYFHSDLKGAPHVVVKSGGEKILEDTRKEAGIFSAINSRAWREGLGNVDVYWVEPEQVTKDTPSGEYLPKGSYMIKGERNYLTVPLEAAVGIVEIDDMKVPMCGPPSAIKNHSDIVINLKPGQTQKSELGKKIKTRLEEKTENKIDINELIRILPPGPGMVID